MEEIRTGMNALATSDQLDKESALQLTRLFHAMEMFMRQEITHRDGVIAALRAELAQLRTQTELDHLAMRHEDAVTVAPTHRFSKRR